MIKLGALGDFIQACGPFKAIRDHHVGANITLLTTVPFVPLAEATGYFDIVWVDPRPSLFQISGWVRLRRLLRSQEFTRVYDLQTSDRTAFYFRLFERSRLPEWSGIVPGCSHPHRNPKRDTMHTLDRQSEQLGQAGIDDVPSLELGWLSSPVEKFRLPRKYALLVPGGSAERQNKRWPVKRYREVAGKLVSSGINVFLVGDATERELHAQIAEDLDGVVSLGGKTSLAELAELSRSAEVSVGNDTGPMHIIAAGKRPTVVLFGVASDPELCAPRGENVRCLMGVGIGSISNLSVGDVWTAIRDVAALA